jgi:hypothetical protein
MPNPKTVTIAVVGINPDGSLDLAIGVNSGDTVIWQVEDGSGVKSIDAIVDSSATIQLFDDGGPSDDPPSRPPVRNPSKKWSGKISNIGTRVTETYTINYTRENGTPGTHDPKIIANP